MGKFMNEVNIRQEVEKENPRKAKDWIIDLASIAAIVVWIVLPIMGGLKILGILLLFTWGVIRYTEYKKWDDDIKKEVQKRIDEE